MGRRSRFALWLIALLVCIPLYLKGRVSTGKSGDAAFLRGAGGTVAVRLAGDVPSPGIYRLPVGVTPRAAINMTVPDAALSAVFGPITGGALAAGDMLTLVRRGGHPAQLFVGRMPAKEMMLLEIPLDADRLQESDWDLLPGIGPVLAAKIAADRQKNGAFGSVAGLLRVPGIGPAKLAAIRRYF